MPSCGPVPGPVAETAHLGGKLLVRGATFGAGVKDADVLGPLAQRVGMLDVDSCCEGPLFDPLREQASCADNAVGEKASVGDGLRAAGAERVLVRLQILDVAVTTFIAGFEVLI